MVVSLLIYYLLITAFKLSAVSGQTFSFNQTATGPSSVCEGSNVTLQCVVVISNPDNTVTVQSTVWSRNGMSVQVNNASGSFLIPNHNTAFNSTTGGFTDLVITNVTLDDDNTVYTCSAGSANIASSVVLNVTGPPSPINDFNIREICSTTISGVSWTPSSGDPACGPVSHKLTISPIDQMIMTMRITDTSYDITGLSPDTPYNLTVISSNMAGSVEFVIMISTPSRPSGVNITNTTASEDNITVTWNNASSTNCGGILYYIVMISSDEHSNIMNAIMNVTDLSLLTATFTDLMSDTNYTIAVTPYNRVAAGMTTTVTIRTSSPAPTQSNNATNPSNSPTNPSNSPTSPSNSPTNPSNSPNDESGTSDINIIIGCIVLVLFIFAEVAAAFLYVDIREGSTSNIATVVLKWALIIFLITPFGIGCIFVAMWLCLWKCKKARTDISVKEICMWVFFAATLGLGAIFFGIYLCFCKKKGKDVQPDTIEMTDKSSEVYASPNKPQKDDTTDGKAADQSLYCYARTGPINVVVPGGKP